MKWESEGIVLGNKSLMENKLVTTLFTRDFGLRKGLISRRCSCDIGNVVYCRWSARLEDQLGYFTLEVNETISSFLFNDSKKLKVLNAVISVMLVVLPENDSKQSLYDLVRMLLMKLKLNQAYYREFIELELAILRYSGYQLDLSKCAATGIRDELYYISPKTGKSVSKTAGAAYHSKLFVMPKLLYFIVNGFPISSEEIEEGEFSECIKITGFFIESFLFKCMNIDFPYYRRCLTD